MTSAPTASTSTGVVLLDSLTANEFAIEIGGQRASGIFSVQGLVSFRRDSAAAQASTAFEPILISKAVQRDPQLPFNTWLLETLTAKDAPAPRRDLTILAIDDGVTIRQWKLRGCCITEVRYSDFDTAKSDLVSEVLTIQFEQVEATFATV